MLGHTPQCSGVSTQVLAECTPALAGEGRKNQSLLVPNVLERAEERRSTLEGVSESRTGRGETEASGSPHRLAKGVLVPLPTYILSFFLLFSRGGINVIGLSPML